MMDELLKWMIDLRYYLDSVIIGLHVKRINELLETKPRVQATIQFPILFSFCNIIKIIIELL